jgi:hypothetical protein
VRSSFHAAAEGLRGSFSRQPQIPLPFLLSCITQEKGGSPPARAKARLSTWPELAVATCVRVPSPRNLSSPTSLAVFAARDGHDTLMTSITCPASMPLPFVSALFTLLSNDGLSHYRLTAPYHYWLLSSPTTALSVNTTVPMPAHLSQARCPVLYVRLGSRSSTRSPAPQPDLRCQQGCSFLQAVTPLHYHYWVTPLAWVQ